MRASAYTVYTGHCNWCAAATSRHDNYATCSSERYGSLHTELRQTGCAVDIKM